MASQEVFIGLIIVIIMLPALCCVFIKVSRYLKKKREDIIGNQLEVMDKGFVRSEMMQGVPGHFCRLNPSFAKIVKIDEDEYFHSYNLNLPPSKLLIFTK
jgi:hypothetical protein